MHHYDRFDVRDEITGEHYHWGQANYVRLDPQGSGTRAEPAADPAGAAGGNAPTGVTRR